MGEVIRFTLDAKKITLLLHNNGNVSMLRNGETTYKGSPPTWDSILHWSNEWSTDDRALEAVYNEILPSNIDVGIKKLIIFMKKNNMVPNFYAKTDYLFVKTADDLVPLYVSSEGAVKYLKKVGYSFASVGLIEPEIWLLDKTDTLIRVGELDIGLNVVEDEALTWESDSEGTYRWLHPIYRWVTEKDADVIPEWLKKMVEKHPKFRGWIVSNTFEEEPPSTTCCPQNYLSFSNTTGFLPDTSQSINRDISGNRVVFPSYKDISGCVYKDNSGNRVVCPSYTDISGCVFKDNSGNRVVCPSYQDISGCVFKDNSGNRVSCSYKDNSGNNTYGGYFDADKNVRPIWSTYRHNTSTFAYSTTTQNPNYNYNRQLHTTPCYYDYDNLNSWQNQAYNKTNTIYQPYTTMCPESTYTNLIADVKKVVDRIYLLQNEQFRLINDVKCKLNLLPNSATNVSTCSVSSFSVPNYSTFSVPNYSSFSTLSTPNVSSFLTFSSPTLSTIAAPSISTLNTNTSQPTVKSDGCCTLS